MQVSDEQSRAWLAPSRPIESYHSIVALDRRLLRIFDADNPIWRREPLGSRSHDDRVQFTVDLFNLAAFAEACCLTDWIVFTSEFPIQAITIPPEFWLENPWEDVRKEFLRVLRSFMARPNNERMIPLLEEGSFFYDMEVVIQNFETLNRHVFRVDDSFLQAGACAGRIGSYQSLEQPGRMRPYSATVDERIGEICDFRSSRRLDHIFSPGSEGDENRPSMHLLRILRWLTGYESSRGVDIIPDVYYAHEFSQTLQAGECRQQQDLLLAAYQSIDRSKSQVAELRRSILPKWVKVSSIPFPSVFLILLAKVSSPAELVHEILSLRQRFANFRKMRGELHDVAARGSDQKFMKLYKSTKRAADAFVAEISKNTQSTPSMVPVTTSVEIPVEIDGTLGQAVDLGDVSIKGGKIIESIAKIGLGRIVQLLMRRRVRPLHGIWRATFKSASCEERIRRIWDVELEARDWQVADICAEAFARGVRRSRGDDRPQA